MNDKGDENKKSYCVDNIPAITGNCIDKDIAGPVLLRWVSAA
jgi:hypothetical protein